MGLVLRTQPVVVGFAASRALSSVAASAGSHLPPARARNARLHVHDPRPMFAPKALRMAESEKMGVFDLASLTQMTQAATRPVPKSAREFSIMRKTYQQQVGQLRLKFKAEWDVRRARELKAATLLREHIDADKARLAAAKLIRKQKRAADHERYTQIEQERIAALKEVRRGKRAAYFNKVALKRAAWLQALNTDAKDWVAQSEINEKITADLFSMTRPWQFDEYNDLRASTAADRAGVVEFEEEWESDLEEEDLDQWGPTKDRMSTGIQLDELYQSQRTPSSILGRQEWMEKYIKGSSPAFSAGVREVEKAPEVSSNRAYNPAEALPLSNADVNDLYTSSVAAPRTADMDLDTIYDMIAAEGPDDKPSPKTLPSKKA